MNKKNMESGQKIQQELSTINNNLNELRDKKENPTADDFMWCGRGISPVAGEKIRSIAINSLVSKRRSLQREFNKL